jgi:hypothetical protein
LIYCLKGLSKVVYKSIYNKINYPGTQQFGDFSWLNLDLKNMKNPLAIGQLINDEIIKFPANGNESSYTQKVIYSCSNVSRGRFVN